MANMTFGVNLIPKNSNNTQQTLGNSENKWDIYANKINGEDPVTLSNTSVISYTGNEKVPLRLGNNNVYTDLNSLSSYFGGSGSGQNVSLTNYTLQINNISSLPYTNSTIDNNITSKMVVLESTLSNPAAQTGDWTITTADGYVTIDGSISGTTNLTLVMGVSNTTAPTIQTNLSSNAAVNLLQDNPKPGVTGVLPLGYGGTGVSATDNADLLSKLGAVSADDIKIFKYVEASTVKTLINCTGNVVNTPFIMWSDQYCCLSGRIVIDNFVRTGSNPGVQINLPSGKVLKHYVELQNGYRATENGLSIGEVVSIFAPQSSSFLEITTTETFTNVAGNRLIMSFNTPMFGIN